MPTRYLPDPSVGQEPSRTTDSGTEDNSEANWEPPILELSRPVCRWLATIAASRLAQWGQAGSEWISREDATALASFLADHLPEDEVDVPPLPSMAVRR